MVSTEPRRYYECDDRSRPSQGIAHRRGHRRDEDQLARIKVRATSRQVEQLLCWAEPFEKRTWAIESVGGMGYLLAQQLVARGRRCARCASDLGCADPGVGHEAVEQERSQRCPLDRRCCLASPERFARLSRLITPRSFVSSQSVTGI